MNRKGANQITNLGGGTPLVSTASGTAFANIVDIDISKWSKDERSMLVYAEAVSVDAGGLMEGIRMNEADFKAIKKFKDLGLLDAGRIPGAMIYDSKTHWVILTDAGWAIAAKLRRERSKQVGTFATSVFAVLKEEGNIK